MDPETTTPHWSGVRFDVGWAIHPLRNRWGTTQEAFDGRGFVINANRLLRL